MQPKSTLIAWIIAITLVSGLGFAGDTDGFPLRKKYPDLEPITTLELARARAAGEALIIDVRTKAEFDAIHIKNAINVPHILTDENHAALKAASEKPHRYMVFYCNGIACTKSYKAAELAMLLRFKDVRNYDAGIIEWAEKYPEETIFFDSPMNAEDVKANLIPESAFKEVLVKPTAFIDMMKSGKFQVYDIRDSRERVEYPMELPNLKQATLDELQQLLKEGKFPKSHVLLLDNVGRQVVWAQYYLKRFGVTDYFFLAGGVDQWRAGGLDSKGNPLGKLFGRVPSKK
jgi:rhodanese-related sulfurtransferase